MKNEKLNFFSIIKKKSHMIAIPIDVLQLIGDKLIFKDLISFKKSCKYLYRLKIYDIPSYIHIKLNDYILKRDDIRNSLRGLIVSGDKITETGISLLTNLRSLSLHNNTTITDTGCIKLIRLESLNIIHSPGITDEGLASLRNLSCLCIVGSQWITNKGISQLSNLTTLTIKGMLAKITVEGFISLKLKTLKIVGNPQLLYYSRTRLPHVTIIGY